MLRFWANAYFVFEHSISAFGTVAQNLIRFGKFRLFFKQGVGFFRVLGRWYRWLEDRSDWERRIPSALEGGRRRIGHMGAPDKFGQQLSSYCHKEKTVEAPFSLTCSTRSKNRESIGSWRTGKMHCFRSCPYLPTLWLISLVLRFFESSILSKQMESFLIFWMLLVLRNWNWWCKVIGLLHAEQLRYSFLVIKERWCL